MALTEDQINDIKVALKRCSPETIDAAIRFRSQMDVSALPAVIFGIVRRFMPPESTIDLSKAKDETRLIEDLGIDSLTMLEIVLAVEESLGIGPIDNEELKKIRTLGDIKAFISQKVSSGPQEKTPVLLSKLNFYSREQILLSLPQQPPFLFLDTAEIEGDFVRAKYRVTGEEYFLQGHFKDNPVFPASILFEAMGQAGCLWVFEKASERLGISVQSNELLFASLEGAHFYKMIRPGEVIDIELRLAKLRAPLAVFSGTAKVKSERAATIDSLSLALLSEVPSHVFPSVHAQDHVAVSTA